MNAAYLCPRCKGPIQAGAEAYRCAACVAEYPVRLGVPVFIPGAAAEAAGDELPAELVVRVCSAMNLPDEPPAHAALREIFRWNHSLPDLALTAENYLLQRLGISDPRGRAPASGPPVLASTEVRYTIERSSIPASLPPETTKSWNVRLANTGSCAIPASGASPVFLAYRWRDAAGAVVPCTELRTALPVDVAPGRALTVPLQLTTPARTGRFALEVLLAQEGPVWHGPGARASVTVTARCLSAVPAHWLTLHRLPETYNYQTDHEIGRVFFKEELARSRRSVRRVLEVGGGSNPMTWDLPADVICADVDIQALQVGRVRHGQARPNVRFVAADAAALPFRDGAFDCAVVFAALHHLADPAHCLREMHRVVERGGFVAVLCEPIGSYLAETLDAQFRKELADGVNEQVFTVEEYVQMFAAAGLVASRAVIDGWSFKAILRDAGPLRWRAASLARACRGLGVGLQDLAGKAERRLKRLLLRAG